MNTVADRKLLNRENPWPGLLAFSEDAQEYFNGREAESDELFRLIRREQLTLLYGHSGLGKSSLLNAGLFPRLRGENYLPVPVRIDHRRESPAAGDQMLGRLLAACREHGVEAPEPEEGETLWEYLHRKDTTFWSPRNHPVTPVFVVDQFEEVFTLGRSAPEKSRDFLVGLGNLINNEIPDELQERLNADPAQAGRYAFRRTDYRIVLSLREDFLPDLEHQLRDVVRAPTQNSVRLKRMTGQQAHDALVATGGHLLAPGVAPLIIRFLAARSEGDSEEEAALGELEIEPALLSVFARELNERRKERGLERIEPGLLQGSKSEILSAFYEKSFEGLNPEVRVFVEESLLTDSGYRDSTAVEDAVRRPGVTLAALESLIDQRILRREERFGTQRVELTHDVLTRIVRESRDERRRAEEEAERTAREKAERRRMRKRTRQMAAVAGVFLLLSVVSLGFMFEARGSQRRAEESQKETEEALRTAARALQQADSLRSVAEAERELAVFHAGAAERSAERAEASAQLARRREAEAAAERDRARRLYALSEERRERLEELVPRPEKLSDLAGVDLAGSRRLALGASVADRLGGDQLRYAGRPFAVWLYEGRADEIVRIDHRSSDFDAYLYLFDAASGERIATNDDAGGGLDSRIEARLPQTGTYAVVASTWETNVDGAYVLSLTAGDELSLQQAEQGISTGDARPRNLSDLGLAGGAAPADAEPITRDDPRRGALHGSSRFSGGRAYGLWMYEGEAGEVVRIDHESEEFDAYLYLFELETGELLGQNDDGGASLNSRIEVRLPRTGTYVIVPSSFGRGAQGAYTLTVSEGSEENLLAGGQDFAAQPRPQRLADLGLETGTLPAGAARIPHGVSLRAVLSRDSPSFAQRRVGVWFYQGQAGETVRIDHRSSDFDAYLYLFDLASGDLLASDDDGGEGVNSRIETLLPGTGTYVIVASSFGTAAEGEYEISVSDGTLPAETQGMARPRSLADLGIRADAVPARANQIPRNGMLQGVLSESSPAFGGRRYAVWTFEGTAGESVRIDQRSSDFDTYLYLFDLASGDLVAYNDDAEGGTGVDSRIEARLPRTGTYVVLASSFGTERTGAYEIELHTGSRLNLQLPGTNLLLAGAAAAGVRRSRAPSGRMRRVR